MKLAQIEINTFGGAPFAEHNMPCAVCRTQPAVLDLSIGVMEPCWDCQSKGWILNRQCFKRSWLSKLLRY